MPIWNQVILADFIAEGHFSRHLRRMLMLYSERSEALQEAGQTYWSDDATGPLRLSCEFERLGGRLRSYAVGLEKSQVLKGCRQRPAARDVLFYPARSEQFRSAPRTCLPLCGRLSVR
jgi:hypothetical protein